MTALPETTKTICNDCPWRRVSAPGWLGPLSAEEWIALAHGEGAIACHQTIVEDESWQDARQCGGAAQYRRNVCKLPKNPEVAVADEPDTEKVFGRSTEFFEHHGAFA